MLRSRATTTSGGSSAAGLLARGRYLGAYLEGHLRGQPHHPIETCLREIGAGGVINGEMIGARCA